VKAGDAIRLQERLCRDGVCDIFLNRREFICGVHGSTALTTNGQAIINSCGIMTPSR